MPRFGGRCRGGPGRRYTPSRSHLNYGTPRPSVGTGGSDVVCRRNRHHQNFTAITATVYGGCGGPGTIPTRVYNYGPSKPANQETMVEKQKQETLQAGRPAVQAIDKPDANALQVKSVDLRFQENTKAHHTDKYDIVQESASDRRLVLRRGQAFNLDIDFSREYDASKDDLQLIFEFGENPVSSKGTYVEFALSDKDKPNEWGAKIITNKGKTLSICVFTPPTLYVGKWEFGVDVIKKGDTSTDLYSYEHDKPFYFLFNPWNREDDVYLNDEDQLKEYILNESGKIYSGSQDNITSKPWNFGQFEENVLDCALYLLDESGLNLSVRGDPVLVVRKLSALLNSNDDDGVLLGNWSGHYEGGRSPLSWTGSVAILERYWKHKRTVKYGQCWVFSGVGTTLCRTLGIPARSVTNFASAHDTDGSVTIDVHYNSSLKIDPDLSDDSVWNFHVWNEAWMARPKLAKEFSGWQAFDGTPQETSDDVYCCGPVPVEAIKRGEINVPYDAPFVFAEVNADRMFWVPNHKGKLECAHIDKNAVGKYISTKVPNSQERLDVSNCYKHDEGSSGERAAVLKANQTGSTRHDLYQKPQPKDVEFFLKQDCRNTWMGGDFEVFLHMRNNTKEERTVGGRMAVSTMYYTGVLDTQLKNEAFNNVTIKPGQEVSEKVVVTAKEYHGHLQDCGMLEVSVWAMVQKVWQQFTTKRDFRLRKPHLTIKAPSEAKKGKEIQVDVSFNNPLDIPLTECFLAVDGLTKELEFPLGNVNPKGTFHTTIPITPKKLGQLELILSFNSRQLYDINGSHPIFIRDV